MSVSFKFNMTWPDPRFIRAILNPEIPLDWTLLRRTMTTMSWHIDDRMLDEHLIYLLTGGVAEARCGGKTIQLRAGDWLWLQPGIRHSFRNIDPTQLTDVFHMRFRVDAPPIKSRDQTVVERLLRGAHSLNRTWEEMILEFEIGRDQQAERLRGLLASLLIEAGRLASAGDRRGLSYAQTQAITRLAEQRRYEVRPAELARAAGLSPEYFARLFRRTYQLAPRQWLVQKRLEMGAHLLRETVANISEIAEVLGYPDIFQFSRRFKKVFGVSPVKYRHSHRYR